MASVHTRTPGSKLPPPPGGRFGSPHGSSAALAGGAATPGAALQACPPTPETAGYGGGGGGGGRPRPRSTHSGSATPSDDMSASLASAATSYSSAADQLLFAPASVEDAVHAVPSLLSQMLSGRTDEQVGVWPPAAGAWRGCWAAGGPPRSPPAWLPPSRSLARHRHPLTAGAGCAQAARLLPRGGAPGGDSCRRLGRRAHAADHAGQPGPEPEGRLHSPADRPRRRRPRAVRAGLGWAGLAPARLPALAWGLAGLLAQGFGPLLRSPLTAACSLTHPRPAPRRHPLPVAGPRFWPRPAVPPRSSSSCTAGYWTARHLRDASWSCWPPRAPRRCRWVLAALEWRLSIEAWRRCS